MSDMIPLKGVETLKVKIGKLDEREVGEVLAFGSGIKRYLS